MKSTKDVLLAVVDDIDKASTKNQELAAACLQPEKVLYYVGMSMGYLNVVRMFKKHLDNGDDA